MKDWILLAALILGAAFAERPMMDKQKESITPIPIVIDSIPDHREPPQAPQKPPPRARSHSLTWILDCIKRAEGTADDPNPYLAVSRTGKYRGAFQTDRDFFLTYGGDPAFAGVEGDPSTWRWEQASPTAQDEVAARGYAARGLAPWPPAGRCR